MNRIKKEFYNAIDLASASEEIKDISKKRVKEVFLSWEDNEHCHFCVYFPAYDPARKLIFIGHHKKSGLWLANGGHLDKNETPKQALKREIAEEWGFDMEVGNLSPSLLTITEIENNPAKKPCKTHYDIWYFIPQNSDKFAPDQNLLAKEFYETAWKTFPEARSLAKDKNTLIGIDNIEKIS
jgi:8-oxo-dGTP pyrophosphatase MutT (NUDIX family)